MANWLRNFRFDNYVTNAAVRCTLKTLLLLHFLQMLRRYAALNCRKIVKAETADFF